MQVDDPPYLSVGTAVSAKYKGAFCEAKVSKVDRMVKCKVTYKSGLGSGTVTDNEIKGTLRVGQQVQVKHPDHKELVESIITKIQDCSQYTVVFDDGDITTLRRTALCLKSGRHFNESETLDQLPLTHPEHFGIPVMGGRRGRRNRTLKDESSDEEIEEENEPDLEGYTQDIGRVVSVETGEHKRGKEKWFPGLIVIPSAQPTVKINVKDEFLIRSFRDDRYYTVPKKEVNEYNRDQADKIESSGLAEAIQKANKFLDHNELPLHWEKSSLFNISGDSDSEDNASDTSDEEQSEEKDRFVAQLYKFMDDSGTPLNKTPVVSNKDIDLHRLFLVVHKMGGYNRVTNQNKWKSVTAKMKLSVNQNISNQIKSVYKKCLVSYEGFHRTLGVTMFNPTRNKKTKGRSLIRDKDRTPIGSPRPDDDIADKPADNKKETITVENVESKVKRKKIEPKEKEETPKKSKTESRDASSDILDVPSTSGIRPKRHENKTIKDKKVKPPQGEKVKVLVEKIEEAGKKEEKVQFTRSKSLTNNTIITKPVKEAPKEMVITRQSKEAPPTPAAKAVSKPVVKKVIPKEEEVQEKDKKPKLKKKIESDKSSSESGSAIDLALSTANVGDKLIVYYGPTNESKVTYEAKVVDIDKDQTGPIYLVHYTGWNTRYDEWIPASRIAENLSSGVKCRRTKVPAPVNVKPASSSTPPGSGTKPVAAKRNRVTSVSSRGPQEDKQPRSTTPSSVTSSSSRTKSPATPATRSKRLADRQESSKKRRISAQTDASVPSESESDSSESELELPRTRSGSIKSEETDVKVYRKRVPRPAPPPKPQKRKEHVKEDEDTEKDEEHEKSTKEKRIKKTKKSAEKSAEESDDEEDGIGHPKGRDFDLNQIRSELKGFSKALKVPAVEIEKDSVSSSDDSSVHAAVPIKEDKDEAKAIKLTNLDVTTFNLKLEEAPPKLSPKLQSPKLEKSSSSEDIYEFKEPEPFEFESRSKLVDDKIAKKRIPRIFEDLEKSPRRRGAKSPLSPGKPDKLDLPEPRTYSRVPKKIHISDDEDDEDTMEEEDIPTDFDREDPFDKLIVSPSFNLIRTSPEKAVENKPIPASLLDEPLNLFRELPETSDEFSRDMELSDCESQTQIFTRADTLFTNTFSKSPPGRNTPDLEYSSIKNDEEGKTTNSDDDEIQAQIQRAIASSSTDDESNDVLVDVLPSASGPSQKPDESNQTKTLPILRITPIAPVAVTSNIMKEAVVPLVLVSKEPDVTTDIDKKELNTPKPAKSEQLPKETNPPSPKKPIDPALQETDSSLLESIVSKPPLILNPKLDDTGKELTVKTGTKIADSILQKFNFIKNNIEAKPNKLEPSTSSSNPSSCSIDKLDTKPGVSTSPKLEVVPEPSTSSIDKLRTSVEAKVRLGLETKPSVEIKQRQSIESKPSSEVNPEPIQEIKSDNTDITPVKPVEVKEKPVETKAKIDTSVPSTSKIEVTEIKRRRRVISKAYIDESESDSSDSENLVIARSDDESQSSSSDHKPLIQCKDNTDSNMSLQKIFTTDDSQSQPEEERRNFSFENIKPKEIIEEKVEEIIVSEPPPPAKELEIKNDTEPKKEEIKEEQDPNLHSLLLCEEEIPRSPAPAPELPNPPEVPSSSSVHEMPFASAPGTSNSKMLLEPKKFLPAPLIIPPEKESRLDAQTVIENTPPTTPESTISNLSPRGDNGNISPNSNDSKSNEGEPDFDVDHRRTSSMKVSPYSEEDTQPGDLHSVKKVLDTFGPPVSCRKRRRSSRISEDGPSGQPSQPKRGRKARQRRDSDSDDASESSVAGSGGGGTTPRSTSSLYDRSARSPRPSKYNFFVEFDPSLDSAQRIAVLQQKLCELRKTYADVKAELAAVERRRKKIRRREREALKSAKQEMACA